MINIEIYELVHFELFLLWIGDGYNTQAHFALEVDPTPF